MHSQTEYQASAPEMAMPPYSQQAYDEKLPAYEEDISEKIAHDGCVRDFGYLDEKAGHRNSPDSMVPPKPVYKVSSCMSCMCIL